MLGLAGTLGTMGEIADRGAKLQSWIGIMGVMTAFIGGPGRAGHGSTLLEALYWARGPITMHREDPDLWTCPVNPHLTTVHLAVTFIHLLFITVRIQDVRVAEGP
jgi:hypothetical protein